MITTNLTLVRHGQSVRNAGRRGETSRYPTTGTPDAEIDLTPQGRLQAILNGLWLRDEGVITPDVHLVTSCYIRARRTGKLLAPYRLWESDRRWNERNFRVDPELPDGTENAEPLTDLEQRVRQVLGEYAAKNAVAITHCLTMHAARIAIEGLDFGNWDRIQRTRPILPGQIMQYEEIRYDNGELSSLRRRSVNPSARDAWDDGKWVEIEHGAGLHPIV